MAPFNPGDDRFYDSLANSGQTYQKYRDRVAEEQAAHAREMGDIYGQMPEKTLQAGMQGADWRQNREMKNQAYQANQGAMNRAEEQQGMERERFAHEKGGYASDDARRARQDRSAEAEEAFWNSPAQAQDAQKLGLGPAATRREMDWAAKSGASQQELANARLSGQSTQLGMAQTRQQMADAKEQRAIAHSQVEIDALAAQPEGQDKMAKVNDIAARNGLRPEMVSAAAQVGTRKFLADQAAATRGADTAANLDPIISDVRRQAIAMKDQVNQLKTLKESADSEYVKAASSGKLGAVGEYVPGYQTSEQADIRQNAVQSLRQMGENGLADEIESSGFSGVDTRIKDAVSRAYARREAALKHLVDANPRLANDPVVRESVLAMQQLKQQMQTGRKQVNLVGSQAPGAAAPSWVSGGQGPQLGSPSGPINPITGGTGFNPDPLQFQGIQRPVSMPAGRP